MFDAARAVEVLARPRAGQKGGYGSGYCIGGDMVITCAHVLPDDLATVELSLRHVDGRETGVKLLWRNRDADVAILEAREPGALQFAPVSIADLPALTTGDRLDFVMYGWPRAGDVATSAGSRKREPVQVNGEIKLAEAVASKTGLLRLRPQEHYPALSEGSFWMGMSGAAVFCHDYLVAIQSQQPSRQLPGYLGARPLRREVLRCTEEGGPSASDLLEAAGVRIGIPFPYRAAARAGRVGRPQTRAAHPFLLLETGQVVGRADLRAELERFLSKSGQAAKVLVLFGVGGTGKSALAWDAWKRLRDVGGRRQFWYSFYDGRASGSFQGLLTELASFLGLPRGDDAPAAAVDDVIDALIGDDIVLFLDGIERCLRCYQRPLAVGDLDAVRVQEHKLTSWGSHELGFASDAAAQFFLQATELATCQVVATSRVVPSEYFTSGGSLRSGVAVHLVDGLSAAEAAELLSATGLVLDPAAAADVAETFGGHPLALQLLARQARNATHAGLDLAAWLAAEGYTHASGSGSATIRNQLFTRAASFLSVDARLALATTGALGGSLDLQTLRDIAPAEPFDDERLAAVVLEITTSGLGLQTADGQLACHPLMAAAAIDHLTPDQTRQLVEAIGDTLSRRYSAISSNPYPLLPQSEVYGYAEWFVGGGQVSDRAEAMALCHALVRLQQWLKAAQVYEGELELPIRGVLGANFEAVELLQALAAGWASQPEGVERTQVLDGVHGLLAHHLLMTGQIHRAEMVLGELSAADTERNQEARRTAASVALHLGDLRRALRLASDALHEARSRYQHASNHPATLDLFTSPFDWIDRNAELMIWPVHSFVQAAVLCSRILRVGDRPAEAAILLREGRRLRWQQHSQCQACRGALLRGAAELLLPSQPSLALAALGVGKDLQEQEGKLLEGLESDVLVTAAVTMRGATTNGVIQDGGMPQSKLEQHPGGWADLTGFLGDTGFVLYQLFLRGALAVAASGPGAEARPQALGELEALDAKFLLSQLSRTPHGIDYHLPRPEVAHCVGWLIEQQQEDAQPEGRDADLEPQQQQVVDDVHQALDAAAAVDYPAEVLRELAALRQGADVTTVSPRTSAIWDTLAAAYRLRAQYCLDAGDTDGCKAALTLAVDMDCCDAQSLAQLATLAWREGDRVAADAHIQRLRRIADDATLQGCLEEMAPPGDAPGGVSRMIRALRGQARRLFQNP